MTELNDFIIEKQPILKTFLRDISEMTKTPINEIPTAHTGLNFGKEMAFLVECLYENIGILAEEFPNEPLIPELKIALEGLLAEAAETPLKVNFNTDESSGVSAQVAKPMSLKTKKANQNPTSTIMLQNQILNLKSFMKNYQLKNN